MFHVTQLFLFISFLTLRLKMALCYDLLYVRIINAKPNLLCITLSPQTVA